MDQNIGSKHLAMQKRPSRDPDKVKPVTSQQETSLIWCERPESYTYKPPKNTNIWQNQWHFSASRFHQSASKISEEDAPLICEIHKLLTKYICLIERKSESACFSHLCSASVCCCFLAELTATTVSTVSSLPLLTNDRNMYLFQAYNCISPFSGFCISPDL